MVFSLNDVTRDGPGIRCGDSEVTGDDRRGPLGGRFAEAADGLTK